MMKLRGTALDKLGSLLVVFALLGARASSQTITKIADTGTSIPNGTGSFTGLFNLPTISGSTVALYGSGAAQGGFYTWNGASLSRLVDLNSAIPSGTGNFTNLISSDFSISNNAVVFLADGTAGQSGIYRAANGVLTRVIDVTFNLPGTSTKFQSFSGPSEGGGVVAFAGTADGWIDQNGVFTIAGTTITPIVTTSTPLPGSSENFLSSFMVANNNGQLAFKANTLLSQPGIYGWSGSALSKVSRFGDTMPVINQAFTDFLDALDIDGGKVIFSGISTVAGGYDQGIYSAALTGGGLTRLVDTATTIPGTTVTFANLEGFKMINGTLVFSGSDTNYFNGVYALSNGTITKVLAPGDSLSAKTVRGVNSGWQGFSTNNQIAMSVDFTDNSQGIYLTTLNTSSVAPPSFNSPTLATNGFKLTLSLTAGQTYRLQATTNFTNPAGWTTLTNITSSPSSLMYTDIIANSFSRRFYRLISP